MNDHRRVLFVGDVHGNTSWFEWASDYAVEHGCTAMVQCGDLGYWPHVEWGQAFLDDISKSLEGDGLELFWIDGNHDNHDAIEGWMKASSRSAWPCKIDDRWPLLRYIPRGMTWDWGGTKFLGLGGGFSIDKDQRILGASYWPQELITIADTERCFDVGKVDVLVSHDAPIECELGSKITGERFPQSESNQKMVSAVRDQCKPEHIVHGHWHRRYTKQLGRTTVIGLDCDGSDIDKGEGCVVWDAESGFDLK